MYTDLDERTADDAATITAINNEFARVHYARPLPVARKASRPTMLIAGGLAAASVAVVAVVAATPADRPAFGWTAEARSATPDEPVQWTRDPAQDAPTLDAEAAVNPSNDGFYPLQWAPTAVHAQGAWSRGWDGTGARVAIIDGLHEARP